MHIDSALKGVPEDHRCSGYKTHSCALKKDKNLPDEEVKQGSDL